MKQRLRLQIFRQSVWKIFNSHQKRGLDALELPEYAPKDQHPLINSGFFQPRRKDTKPSLSLPYPGLGVVAVAYPGLGVVVVCGVSLENW
jgi:hypothetical protein